MKVSLQVHLHKLEYHLFISEIQFEKWNSYIIHCTEWYISNVGFGYYGKKSVSHELEYVSSLLKNEEFVRETTYSKMSVQYIVKAPFACIMASWRRGM